MANYGQESSQSDKSYEGLPAKSDKPHRHRFVKAIKSNTQELVPFAEEHSQPTFLLVAKSFGHKKYELMASFKIMLFCDQLRHQHQHLSLSVSPLLLFPLLYFQ